MEDFTEKRKKLHRKRPVVAVDAIILGDGFGRGVLTEDQRGRRPAYDAEKDEDEKRHAENRRHKRGKTPSSIAQERIFTP